MSTEHKLALLPARLGALVMDFDGVMTDNRVLVDQNGVESVFCHRGDGQGIELLQLRGLPMLVISKEKNPVVLARCAKLQIPCFGAVDSKLPVLEGFCANLSLPLSDVVYLGNDLGDVTCLEAAGCGVVVQDAHATAAGVAQFKLDAPGGYGAVRELCDLILRHLDAMAGAPTR